MNTRYSTNEPALIMERAALDLGCAIDWLYDTLGYEKVVILGFSGGGGLGAFYQSQALRPTVTATPAGDPVDLSGLSPADGLAFIGAHPGRARVLRNWIDPAVTDESDPYVTDSDIDLFRADRTVPLDRDYLARYRQSQLDRMRRIDDFALTQLEEINERGIADRAFVVHRTVADPRFVDVTVDPSDREPGCMYGDPQQGNMAAGGVARFTTVRSWLSTWSFDHTNADAVRNLTSVDTPTLVGCLRGDQAAFVSDSTDMHSASADPQASLVQFRHLNHYLVDQADGVETIVRSVGDWMTERNLLADNELYVNEFYDNEIDDNEIYTETA